MSQGAAVVATPPPAGSSLRRARPIWRNALLAAEVVGTYVAVRILLVGGVGAFPGAGNVYVGPGHPAELKTLNNKGYDGQFVYRLAIEPFTTHRTGHGITFDLPGYRQQRIMTALLARVVSVVPGVSTATALVVVNALAMAVAVVAGLKLAEVLGAGWFRGALLAAPAGAIAGLVADLTEPVAWAAVLVAILAARRHRWVSGAAALTVAVLARETAAIVLIGYLVETAVVLRSRRGAEELRRLWLLVPVAVESGWQLWLWHVWGTLPAISGLRNTGLSGALSDAARASSATTHSSPLPGIGIFQTFFDGLLTGDTGSVVLGVSYLVERIALLALIVAAGLALIRRRARPGLALTVSWVLGALVALSLQTWKDDIQFLRAAMEAWGLSVFVLMEVRTRWANAALFGAAVVATWVAIFFLPRV